MHHDQVGVGFFGQSFGVRHASICRRRKIGGTEDRSEQRSALTCRSCSAANRQDWAGCEPKNLLRDRSQYEALNASSAMASNHHKIGPTRFGLGKDFLHNVAFAHDYLGAHVRGASRCQNPP
jgi:hypothetical protein